MFVSVAANWLSLVSDDEFTLLLSKALLSEAPLVVARQLALTAASPFMLSRFKPATPSWLFTSDEQLSDDELARSPVEPCESPTPFDCLPSSTWLSELGLSSALAGWVA